LISLSFLYEKVLDILHILGYNTNMMKKDTRIFKQRDPHWKTRRALGHKIVPSKKTYSRKGKTKWA